MFCRWSRSWKHIEVLIALRPGEFAEDAAKMGIDVEVVKAEILSRHSAGNQDSKEGKFAIVHSR